MSAGVEVVSGREDAPFTIVHDWVTLSDVSGLAKALYGIYRAHVNHRRGDDEVWPTVVTLAAILGVSKPEKISQLNRELVDLGAIEIRKEGVPRRNRYVIHKTPPAGYAGPVSIGQWYKLNADELAAKREKVAARAERSRQKRRSSPVTPNPGVLETPESGALDTPDSGVEQEEPQPQEVNAEETGTEASSGGLRLANESAPTLPRQGRAKTIRDPKVKNEAADDAEAIRVATEDGILDDEAAALLVKMLRLDRNASTTAGHMRWVAGTYGLANLYETAVAWSDDLDEKQQAIEGQLRKFGLDARDALVVAKRARYALEIRCTGDAIGEATMGYRTRPAKDWLAALDNVIARREVERTEERKRRVEKQLEAAA